MSFPPGTEMFQFPGFALNPYGFRVQSPHGPRSPSPRSPLDSRYGVEGGLPHSEIPGSKLVRSSPRLIAAYHVLHRLSAPRHPPDALTTLDYSHDPCPLGSAQDRQRKTCLSDFSKRHVLLAKHIRRSRLRAGAGSRELGCPACRICCLFTISNIRAAHPKKGRARTSFDIPEEDRVHQRMMVEPVGIEPTT